MDQAHATETGVVGIAEAENRAPVYELAKRDCHVTARCELCRDGVADNAHEFRFRQRQDYGVRIAGIRGLGAVRERPA